MKLNEVAEIVAGGTPSTKKNEYWNGDIAWITPKDLSNHNERYVTRGERNITREGLKNSSAVLMPKNSILFTSRAPIGYIAIAKDSLCTNQGFKSLICNEEKCYYKYMYYWLKNNTEKIKEKANGSTFLEISGTSMKNIEIELPNMETQKKIAKILDDIDKKIELNNQMNDNLFEIINSVYREAFHKLTNFDKAENIANITIGKTPPRSISECFSKNENDINWVSISDLGKNGTYIGNTTERLTVEAVKRYNVKIIPKETVILSFKLTVGRVAITRGEMATNEAIAHFNLNNEKMKYFIYCYLKNFDFQSLGSTSSIAIAVNSKIIKSMPIAIPEKEELEKFNNVVTPLFEMIKNNEIENENLSNLRDTLLPKLMNGEIDLDKIEI